ncbi:hypothetical protein ACFE04_000011 [Oxalis oulophora]
MEGNAAHPTKRGKGEAKATPVFATTSQKSEGAKATPKNKNKQSKRSSRSRSNSLVSKKTNSRSGDSTDLPQAFAKINAEQPVSFVPRYPPSFLVSEIPLFGLKKETFS